mgnify:CR=1 FL=1
MKSIDELPKSENTQAARLCRSLAANIGQTVAEEFAKTLPLSRSADDRKRFQWALNVCSWLEERFSNEELQQIRKACSCQPGSKAEKVKRLYESSADYAEFCERFNREYAPINRLTYDGEALYLLYPACYCSCIKRGDENLTDTWCLCTLGYAERLFSHALSHEVFAQLLESIKTGGETCVIKMIPV